MDVQQIKGIGGQLRKFVGEFGDCFGRSEPREHLYRNRQARLCHWKKTRRTLRAIGIDLRRLRSCAPDDL